MNKEELFSLAIGITICILVTLVIRFTIQYDIDHPPIYSRARVSDVQTSTGGINILNATWILTYPSGQQERDGCSGCTYGEIPVEGSTITKIIGYK
jgi:hypothetical protein